ncbi:MAG: pyridoxamine 5'-phosphate oxidase family protein [Candidatus Hodarchaeales archaeon]|jgi:hypothetical protein
MKIGDMQPLKPYKFLQELVLEGFWPFNRFQSPYNILLLTLFYFWLGYFLFIMYPIPLYFLVAGIFGAISISMWTFGIFTYADRLRETQVEKINRVNRKILVDYLDDLFHPSSIVIGVALMTFTNAILFSPIPFRSQSLIESIQQELAVSSLPIPLVIYIYLITFDVCYRIGLSTYVILVQIKRNILLTQYLRNPKLKPFFSPKDIKSMENADKIHYLALIGGILLIPLALFDTILLFGTCLYLFIAFLTATINILYLKILYYRAIPTNVVNILSSSKFAYFATISNNHKPHVTPMIFVYDGRHIFLTTSLKSVKIDNIRKAKNVALYVEHQKGGNLIKSKGVLIQGSARIYGFNKLTAIFFIMFLGIRMLNIRSLFVKKYPKYVDQYNDTSKIIPRRWRTFPILSRTLIEVIPSQTSYWKGSKFTEIEF